MSTDWPLLSAESEAYAEMLGQVADERIASVVDAIEQEDRLGDDTVELLVAQGIYAAGLPEDCGGSGATLADVALAAAIVATASPALALLLADVHVAGLAALGCDDESGRGVARALAEGARPCVIDAGSSLVGADVTDGRLELHAARAEGAADAASAVVVTENGAYVVAQDAWSGRSCGEPLARTGMRGSRPVPVTLTADVVRSSVTADRLREVRQLLIGAAAVGLADAAGKHARIYAADRHQFGRSLDAIPVVRAKLDRVADQVASHRAALLAQCTRVDEDRNSAARSVAAAATGYAVTASLDMVQVLGGYGYLTEYPIERILRDAVSLRAIAAGTSGAAV